MKEEGEGEGGQAGQLFCEQRGGEKKGSSNLTGSTNLGSRPSFLS